MSQKVWITKYALTDGIIETETIDKDYESTLISVERFGRYSYFHPSDWCASKEEAIAKAEEMRQKKIKSYQKKLQN